MSVLERNSKYLKGHYTDIARVGDCYVPTPSYKFNNDFNEDNNLNEESGVFKFVGGWLPNYNSSFPIHYVEGVITKRFQDDTSDFIHKYSFLFDIENAIKEVGYILQLPNNWDEEGAKVISEETFSTAVQFLRTYSKFLYENKGIKIEVPEINPCKDGTIDLSWHTSQARMLINIRNEADSYFAYYYGDLYNNKMPIKGNVPIPNFSESLAVWMKYLV